MEIQYQKNSINPELLDFLYFDLEYSCEMIGKILNCSESKIRRLFKKYNIKTRNLSESHKGYQMPDSQKIKISNSISGKKHYLYGKKKLREITRKMIETKRKLFKNEKISIWNKNLKGIHLSPNTEFKIGCIPWNKGLSHTEETKKRISNILRGKYKNNKASNWKGGITKINDLIRATSEIKDWKKYILIRDNYTCKLCNKRGGDLNVHHIKSFAGYPDLRLDINNGLTLCVNCHKFIHFNNVCL